jgi:hypothetical protein
MNLKVKSEVKVEVKTENKKEGLGVYIAKPFTEAMPSIRLECATWGFRIFSMSSIPV